MKNKIFIFVIGLLIGAIIASAGFLIFGGNKSKENFNPSQFKEFKEGDMTPPNFSKDKGNFDFNNTDPNNLPEKPSQDL